MPATTYDDRLRANWPSVAVVGPGILSATSAYDLLVPTTVIPSGNRMTSVLPCTADSVAVRNCCTLSADDFVPLGLRLIEATVTLRAAGAGICSSEMSSHHTVPCGEFDR